MFIPTRSSTGRASSACSVTNAASELCILTAARTARSGSSSCATGAPNNASTPSPSTLSIVPPNSMTSAMSRSKASSSNRFARSGSRYSTRPVYPTMSANNTVISRRSSVVVATTWCPQNGQNRAPSGSACRHAEHAIDAHPTMALDLERCRTPASPGCDLATGAITSCPASGT